MSRREGQLFVGRLSKSTRVRDLEDVFEAYGRLQRCEVKYGAEMAYAFVDFEDRRDAEDAIKYENGREIAGSGIVVEWAKGNRRGGPVVSRGFDDCYRCHRSGHWARDCPDDRNYGFRRPGQSGGRYRSPSPRRRRRSRSRSDSRDRDRRKRRRSRSRSRSRSHSRDRRRRSRSRSDNRKRSSRRRSHSRSRSKSKSRSRSKSKSKSVASKSRSRSRSASPAQANGDYNSDRSPSRSPARSDTSASE